MTTIPEAAEADVRDIIRLLPAYEVVRDELLQFVSEEFYNGNWDLLFESTNPAVDPLRLIQEDEYDQSMSDDERPSEAMSLGYAAGHYIFRDE